MAEVRLRKDFYGTLIPKVSSDSLRVTVEFDYKGPAQTLDIEVNSGKRGLWGDYDQESPAYHTSKYVSKSDSFRSYSHSYTMPLSFWGSRKIEDCAAEVVITGEGIHEEAVIWDAYTVNIVVPLEGTISKKQLEYDGTRRSIPASSVPYGKRGLVHIWGRNDTGTTQDLGIHWLVYDPDGYLVEDYSDWSYGHGAGKDHEFIGGRFDLDKAGTYRINIALSMNPSAPEIVDTYYGTLCTVEAPPVEKYDLTTEVYPSGTGYISPSSGTYDAGTKVTITAYSYSGWDFDYWGGDASGILSSTTITMDSDKHAIAYFRYKEPY